ncbi:MAG: hypothetical protein COU10_03495 [Candidatus Harrisonbacteria bacterium CG10_big_fil_rev_8_21_14_0_10_45_28]|uniref:DNA polymerase III delta N-terminal domain-containing protein n=1 Tax=Candidatus Harrisonbacteria bacterium CG10_big_fil_rev_8_21_14_0_10_45_28 TaxID=1974586 RepID=A0A2H0UMP7_9BACT|nr:MAG: hypothetical protein COU10_03495 [Candidatus Harrisonbacteria bacterium CG10_big_fil_rev_8_21_14_0_10_45_28]
MDISEIKKNFEHFVEGGVLAHGYIFYGSDIEEQWRFVREFANYLENGSWEINKKTLSDARLMEDIKEFGIGLVRSFSEFLYQSPNVSSFRLLAVKDASRLNHLAQNAMLKIAEEPPEAGVLILTVNDIGALNPTLVSRFAKIFFSKGKISTTDYGLRTTKLMEDFLSGGKRERSALIKEMVKNEKEVPLVDDFVLELMGELARDTEKNWRALKELTKRYELMRRLNTNKRLQLEAVLQYLE